jgi:DNA replication licensing factor MCM6
MPRSIDVVIRNDNC